MGDVSHVRRTVLKGCLAFGALAFLEPAAGWAASWILLGSRDIELVNDKDFVPVFFLAGAFSSIQLRVKGNGVHMTALRVRFSNEEVASLPVRAHIRAGGHSREIPLPGGHRYISYIALEGRSDARSRSHATVEVWGRR